MNCTLVDGTHTGVETRGRKNRGARPCGGPGRGPVGGARASAVAPAARAEPERRAVPSPGCRPEGAGVLRQVPAAALLARHVPPSLCLWWPEHRPPPPTGLAA